MTTRTTTVDREMELVREYEEAHAAYLELSPKARAVISGRPMVLDTVDLEAVRAAKARLLAAQDDLYAFWKARSSQ